MDWRLLAAVFAGGSAGALARAGVAEALPTDPGDWPWATFVVNITGAFGLGYFATRLQERLPLSAYKRPFLGACADERTRHLVTRRLFPARDLRVCAAGASSLEQAPAEATRHALGRRQLGMALAEAALRSAGSGSAACATPDEVEPAASGR